MLSSKDIEKIFKDGLKLPKQLDQIIYPNEFIHIKSSDSSSHEVLTIFNGDKIVPLKYANSSAWGLVPINREQKMAFELLMDNNVPFVTLAGGAGSGKTILSTAVALQKVIEEEVFRKIVLVKPVVPAGNDIGFLPGTEEEKLKPWMGSFYDAVDNLFGNKYRRKEKGSKSDSSAKPTFTVDSFIDDYRQHGIIETKTFTYMRGRTLSDALVIVDEAQEITPHLAKMMLTRAGFGAKFVFLGDPTDSQIDNVLVDARSNGLVYTIEKMKPFPITGHVTLNKVERSPLAQIAEKYM
jgi:PhoH-like ATPase